MRTLALRERHGGEGGACGGEGTDGGAEGEGEGDLDSRAEARCCCCGCRAFRGEGVDSCASKADVATVLAEGGDLPVLVGVEVQSQSSAAAHSRGPMLERRQRHGLVKICADDGAADLAARRSSARQTLRQRRLTLKRAAEPGVKRRRRVCLTSVAAAPTSSSSSSCESRGPHRLELSWASTWAGVLVAGGTSSSCGRVHTTPRQSERIARCSANWGARPTMLS